MIRIICHEFTADKSIFWYFRNSLITIKRPPLPAPGGARIADRSCLGLHRGVRAGDLRLRESKRRLHVRDALHASADLVERVGDDSLLGRGIEMIDAKIGYACIGACKLAECVTVSGGGSCDALPGRNDGRCIRAGGLRPVAGPGRIREKVGECSRQEGLHAIRRD